MLVAPSTSQDPKHSLVRAALEGLADEPVRVLATTNRRPPPSPIPVPPNAKLVDWVSYAKAMPGCAAVICHAGHGTLARSLACGVPVIACPVAGDMNENAARIRWAGAGVSLPRRLITPRGVRLAVRRLLAEERYTLKARELAAWAEQNSGVARAADEVERLAAGRDRRVVRGRRTPTDAQSRASDAVLPNCGGGTRTHNHRLNRAPLCLIELLRTNCLGYGRSWPHPHAD